MRQALEEIIGILRSSNFDPLIPYINYIVICIIIFILLLILIIYLDSKRKENEYTNSKYVRIALKKGDLGLSHLTSLYQEYFKKYKAREFLVIEFINGDMFLRVRSDILEKVPDLKKDKEKRLLVRLIYP